MSKFHINSKGVPAPCKAQKGNCPFGGADSHFDTAEQAQVHLDNQSEQEHGLLPKVNKNVDYGLYTDEEGPDKMLRKHFDNIGSYNIPFETVEDFEYDISKRKVSIKTSLDLDDHPRPAIINFYNNMMSSEKPIQNFNVAANEFHDYNAIQILSKKNPNGSEDVDEASLARGLNRYYKHGTRLAYDLYKSSQEMIEDYDADPEDVKEYVSKALDFMLK